MRILEIIINDKRVDSRYPAECYRSIHNRCVYDVILLSDVWNIKG